MKKLPWLCVVFFAASCDPVMPIGEGQLMAYVPVYATIDAAAAAYIENTSPVPTAHAGKIYAYDKYLFQNEIDEGIHIISRNESGQFAKTGFIKIPYNTEFVIRDHYLYANSLNNLLVIDISDPRNPKLTRELKGIFPLANQDYPPQQGYFVCPDPGKGIVASWQLKQVESAACRH